MNRTWSTLTRIAPAVALAARWNITCEGLDNVPCEGPGIIVFNHYGTLDAVMVAWAPARKLHRPVRFLAKAELAGVPAVGRMIAALGAIPVDRGSAASRGGAYTEAGEALERGDLVAIAPEQMRSPSLEILLFRAGAARLAQQTGAPLIPCVGWGAQKLLRGDTRLPKLSGADIQVQYLPQVVVSGSDDPVQVSEKIRVDMIKRLHSMQAANRRDEKQGTPWTPHRLGGSAPTEEEGLAAQRRKAERWGRPKPENSAA